MCVHARRETKVSVGKPQERVFLDVSEDVLLSFCALFDIRRVSG